VVRFWICCGDRADGTFTSLGRAGSVDERNRTQDLRFCFDLSTWKVVGPFSREEVGVREE